MRSRAHEEAAAVFWMRQKWPVELGPIKPVDIEVFIGEYRRCRDRLALSDAEQEAVR